MPMPMPRPDPLTGSTDDETRARLLDDNDVELLTGHVFEEDEEMGDSEDGEP